MLESEREEMHFPGTPLERKITETQEINPFGFALMHCQCRQTNTNNDIHPATMSMNKSSSTGSSSSSSRYATKWILLSMVGIFLVLEVRVFVSVNSNLFIRQLNHDNSWGLMSSMAKSSSLSKQQAFFTQVGSIDHESVQLHQPLVDAQGLDLDTSVIITSNLIPTHPNISMINQTIQSLKHLQGLSPEAPIFITVDFPKTPPTNESLARLNQYVQNLKDAFQHRPNMHIIQSTVHRHISGCLQLAIDRIHTKYVYQVQHDFPFIRDIDHTNLRKSLDEYPQYLRNVRFEQKWRVRGRVCDVWKKRLNITTSSPADHVNGLNFTLYRKWSDNNQFALRSYYEELLTMIGPAPRAPENQLGLGLAPRDCATFGQHVYGNHMEEGRYIHHLDGRLTEREE